MNSKIVIIPTYNEAENIEKIIHAVFKLPTKFDLLIVDDNSPDKTAEIVHSIASTYNNLHIIKRKKKLGLGPAYIDGFRWAINKNYSQIYEMDADFSHPPEKLVNMSKKLNSTCDVVIGSRYYNGIRVKNWPKSRVLLSRAASLYVRFITGLPIMDPTAGFVGYKLKVLKEIDLRNINFKGYAFQIALKFHAWKKGFIIKELPITFTDRIHGESKMNISIIGEAIFGILLMKIKSFFKK